MKLFGSNAVERADLPESGDNDFSNGMSRGIPRKCGIRIASACLVSADPGMKQRILPKQRGNMWYVIWTTTGREEYTRDLIQKFVSSELYDRLAIPQKRKKHFQNGKSYIVEKIIFPSYLFVETKRIKDFVSALSTLPVFSVVLHTDDFYSPIYDHEVIQVIKMMNDHDVIDMSTGYMEGEKIRIVSGPLRGFEGHIKKVIRRRGIAIVELNIFNRPTEARLGLELIEK